MLSQSGVRKERKDRRTLSEAFSTATIPKESANSVSIGGMFQIFKWADPPPTPMCIKIHRDVMASPNVM